MASAIPTTNPDRGVNSHPLIRIVLINSRRRPHVTHVIVVPDLTCDPIERNFHVKVKDARWTANHLTKHTTIMMTNPTLNHSLPRLSMPACTTRSTHVTSVTTPSTHPTLILHHLITRTAESHPRLRLDRFKYVLNGTKISQA